MGYWFGRVRPLAALLLVALVVLGGAVTAAAAEVPFVVRSTLPARLVITSIGVDAPVIELGIGDTGEMDSPYGPVDVGWYNFSPTPGNPGNTVLAGHRDWHTGETGVFWRLGELAPGDRISIVLEDGTRIAYDVLVSVRIGPDDMPIGDVIGQTPEEIVTLITCEGSFDQASHDYNMRRVVWAARVA